MTYPKGGGNALPPAKAGDIIHVHAPEIGIWKVDEVVVDFRGRHYYRVSRKTGGAVEWRIIATAGVEILSPREVTDTPPRWWGQIEDQ